MVNELYHHGIKGQRWGKRNGPPYPLNSQTHAAVVRSAGYTGDKKSKSDSGGPNKSGRIGGLRDIDRKSKSQSSSKESTAKKTIKEKLISRYEKQALSKGLSSSEAKKYANKKYEATMKGLKTAAIGLGVAAAATLAYKGARYYKNNYVDEIYKPGTKIQTLSRNPNRQTNETFYGAHRIQDKLQYRGMANNLKGGVGWHRSKDGKPPKIYRLQSELTSTAKVASNNNARKVFNDLRKTDPEFRAYTDNLKTNFDIQKRGRLRYLKKTDAYGAFNRDGLMYGTGDPKQNTKFFNAMKKKGYDGIKDINDRQLNTYYTDANIWFGKSEGYTPKMRQLKTVDADYGKAAKKMMAFNTGRRVATNILARGGVVVGAGALGGANIARRRAAVELSLRRKKKHARRRK